MKEKNRTIFVGAEETIQKGKTTTVRYGFETNFSTNHFDGTTSKRPEVVRYKYDSPESLGVALEPKIFLGGEFSIADIPGRRINITDITQRSRFFYTRPLTNLEMNSMLRSASSALIGKEWTGVASALNDSDP